MKIKRLVSQFICYGQVTMRAVQRTGAFNYAAAILAFVIWMASPYGGRAQTVTLQTGYNFVGCEVNGPGGNSINNASFLYGPGLVSDPNGINNTTLYVWNCASQAFCSRDDSQDEAR